jgi:hypothetical protein
MTGAQQHAPGVAGFNGATTSRSWKLATGVRPVRSYHRRFNGATTSRSWKHGPTSPSPSQPSTLQWSHDLSVVETMVMIDGQNKPMVLQWSHDLSVVETSRDRIVEQRRHGLQWSHDLSVVETARTAARIPLPRLRFNGATTSRSWKPPEIQFRRFGRRRLQWMYCSRQSGRNGG